MNLGAFRQQRRKKKDVKQGFDIWVKLTRYDNIRRDRIRKVCEDVGWIHLAQDMNQLLFPYMHTNSPQDTLISTSHL
jgi:hypothetical protein